MSSGMRYRTGIEEDGEGPPVVLVHGTPLDMRCWDALMPTLSKGLRVIRYDVRGHGTAADSAVGDSYDVLADDLVAVLDEVGIGRAHVIGHSFGGQIVQAFALRSPARLASLTVLCARATPFPPFAAAATSIRADGPEALVEPTLARWFTVEALAVGAPPTEAAIVGYVRACLKNADRTTYAAALELIAGFDVLDRLTEVDVAARFVAAERDEVSTPRELRLSSEATPHGELTVFPSAGHLLPLEHPELLARDLVESLSAIG